MCTAWGRRGRRRGGGEAAFRAARRGLRLGGLRGREGRGSSTLKQRVYYLANRFEANFNDIN